MASPKVEAKVVDNFNVYKTTGEKDETVQMAFTLAWRIGGKNYRTGVIIGEDATLTNLGRSFLRLGLKLQNIYLDHEDEIKMHRKVGKHGSSTKRRN